MSACRSSRTCRSSARCSPHQTDIVRCTELVVLIRPVIIDSDQPELDLSSRLAKALERVRPVTGCRNEQQARQEERVSLTIASVMLCAGLAVVSVALVGQGFQSASRRHGGRRTAKSRVRRFARP